jgi:hypothetical protein
MLITYIAKLYPPIHKTMNIFILLLKTYHDTLKYRKFQILLHSQIHTEALAAYRSFLERQLQCVQNLCDAMMKKIMN